MRWYANSAKGRLRDRLTISSTLNHAERLFVLALAFADNALWGYGREDDLWRQRLPLSPGGRPGPVLLRWKDEALHKPLCRVLTMNRVHPVKAFDKSQL
jgi:hypothetical protein